MAWHSIGAAQTIEGKTGFCAVFLLGNVQKPVQYPRSGHGVMYGPVRLLQADIEVLAQG